MFLQQNTIGSGFYLPPGNVTAATFYITETVMPPE